MKRREFITLMGGGVALTPLAARAQDTVRHVVVTISLPETDPEAQARVSAFRGGLAKRGWILGRNLRLDVRWNLSALDKMEAAAADVVRLKPHVVVVQGSPTTQTFQRLTRTIPIVFVNVSDPLGTGIVANLAHPGGNVTGFVNYEFSVATKWLATLKEMAPTLKRVLVIVFPDNIGQQGMLRTLNETGPSLQIQIVTASVRDRADIEREIDVFAKMPDGGVIVPPNNIALRNRDLIVERCARHRLPAMYAIRPYVVAGGLMSYDTSIVDIYRAAAGYVDQILHGENVGDLPVQAPTKFELVINLKTAKALGITVPIPLLARADEVIE